MSDSVPPMRLYLVRHPKPIVASNTCYGRTDLAVSPQEQARVAAALLPVLPRGVPLFSSPLRRCAGLAEQLAGPLACSSLLFDERLAEIDFGTWEDRCWDTIARAEIDAWADDMAGYRPGGGESVLQMAQRVRAFHADLLQSGPHCAIVICHAGTIRLLLAHRGGLPLSELALHAAQTPHNIDYGAVITLDC
jgi:alpha-ribazole phosphatase